MLKVEVKRPGRLVSAGIDIPVTIAHDTSTRPASVRAVWNGIAALAVRYQLGPESVVSMSDSVQIAELHLQGAALLPAFPHQGLWLSE